jgi:hypothetical protein
MRFDGVAISQVREYSDERPCNIRHSTAPIGSTQYFDEVEARKYFVESHIPSFAEFERWRGKRVLEIDSLLKFIFFLSRRGAGEPSFFFVQATLSHQLVRKLEGAELGSVIGLIRAKHRGQSVQEFTHYGYDRLETCFAATEQLLKRRVQNTLQFRMRMM